ncbi:MAG: Holliday junction branch migration protein RuvA [Desulfomonilaceae bacterium]
MIASLRGPLIYRGVNRVIVDVNGVGYNVFVSLNTLESLPLQEEALLHIHTALRDNSLELYGFATEEEKSLFEMLLNVSGIGPKTSLTILSGISSDGFKQAICDKDLAKLSSIPGIGRKSAERIVVELKEKISAFPSRAKTTEMGGAKPNLQEDLTSSLINLGYKPKIASETAERVLKGSEIDMSLEQAVKLAFKELIK